MSNAILTNWIVSLGFRKQVTAEEHNRLILARENKRIVDIFAGGSEVDDGGESLATAKPQLSLRQPPLELSEVYAAIRRYVRRLDPI